MDSVQTLYQKVFKSEEYDALGIKACEMALEAYDLPEQSIVRSAEVAAVLANLKLIATP